MDDDVARREALARAQIAADPRKFRDYVLVPGHPSGKDRIFLGTLGYRPRNAEDALTLVRLFEAEAKRQIEVGTVHFSRSGADGDLYVMVIEVRGAALRTVWLLDGNVLRLITPFSGFAVSRPRG